MSESAPPFYLLGTPVGHSLSPAMHNAAFQSIGLKHRYHAIETTSEQLPDRLEEIRRGLASGANITVPLKHLAFEQMDEVAESALRCGAVNTVERLEGGRLRGHSTDGEGFLKSMAPSPLPDTAVLFGGGGAAVSVARTLHDKGVPHIYFTVRRKKDVEGELLKRIPSARVRGFTDPNAPHPVENTWFIQSTPLSTGVSAESPESKTLSEMMGTWLPTSCAESVAVDLVYSPEETVFLNEAAARGSRVVSGLGMLVYQAMASFTIWTGVETPESVWWDAAREELAKRGR